MKRLISENELKTWTAWIMMAVMFVSLLITLEISRRPQDIRNYAREIPKGGMEKVEEGVVLPEVGGPATE